MGIDNAKQVSREVACAGARGLRMTQSEPALHITHR